MLPTVDHVTAKPVTDFEIVSWQTNDANGTTGIRALQSIDIAVRHSESFALMQDAIA